MTPRRVAAYLSAGLIVALGVLALVVPPAFAALVAWMQVPPRLYLAALIRAGIGVTLLLAARGARATLAVTFLGGVMVVGGLVTPIIGQGLARPILDAWTDGNDGVVRGWGVAAIVLGGFMLWALGARAPRGQEVPPDRE